MAGDGDGTLEPGESFTLSQALRNVRATAVTGVTSVLSESDPDVTLSQTASAYPNVAVGATQVNTTPFAGSLSSGASCGARVELSLQVTTAEEGAKTITLQVPTGGAGASQAFTQSTPVAIPDNTPAGASSTLAVSGVGPLADVNARVNITHPYDGDLAIMLKSPAGTVVTLSQSRGGDGDNFTATVFDDEAATAIGAGAAPFTGSFRPDQPLSAFDSQTADGTWTMIVVDQAGGDEGTLNSWGIDVTDSACSVAEAPATAGSARGDFNGDGVDDLVVGVPGEDVGAVDDAGVLHVLYGGVPGVSATGSQHWSQSSAGIADSAEAGDRFGAALSAGDFNADGRDDLAVGVPGEDVGSVVDAGAVHVLLGSASGLVAAGSQYWSQNSAGVADSAEAGDRFGSALATGRLNSGALADLVVGVPGESVGAVAGAGVVQVLPGAAGGVTATGSQHWSQDSTGIVDSVEGGDGFGASLAVADVNGAAGDDLAVGVPGEDVGSVVDAGAVHVVLGSASGLVAAGSQYWSQNSAGVADSAEAGDRFGSALATGRLNSGALADLVVGVPGESVAGRAWCRSCRARWVV